MSFRVKRSILNEPFDRRVPRLVFSVLACGLLGLAGCASSPDAIIGVDNPHVQAETVAGAKKHEIFIATTRARDEEPAIFYSGDRGDDVGLARVNVFVPPNHAPGAIERPKNLPPDPQSEFAVLDPITFDGDREFVKGLNSALAARPKGQRTVLVFVHGYNTTLTFAILRLTQFVEDSGYTGVPVLFSWASRGRAFDYVYDLNSTLHARDDLIRTARLIEQTGAEGFDIVAHSMGNFLTAEAMRQAKLQGQFNRTKRLRNIILASPDIDIDVFKKQISVWPKAERRFYVLVSEDDKALRFSRRIAGGVRRLGDQSSNELAALGATVIDLTQVEDKSSLNHSKFAESPEVVQLIGESILAGSSLQTSEAAAGGLVGGLATGLTAIPASIASGGGRVLIVGN